LKNLYQQLAESLSDAGLISKSEFLISNQIPNPNDQIIKNLSKKLDIKPAALKSLIMNKEQAFLSQRLATIRRDVPLDFELEDCAWGDYDKDKVREFFEKMRFHSLLRRFGIEKSDPVKTEKAQKQKAKDDQLRLI